MPAASVRARRPKNVAMISLTTVHTMLSVRYRKTRPIATSRNALAPIPMAFLLLRHYERRARPGPRGFSLIKLQEAQAKKKGRDRLAAVPPPTLEP
jgi:hypothetical protein